MQAKLKLFSLWFLAVFFVMNGLSHFFNAPYYLMIMPPYLPWHLPLVYLTGFGELGLGALLLAPMFRGLARWGLIALLLAIFPANIHMALHHEIFPAVEPRFLLWRLPLQFLLMAWIYWSTSPGRPSPPPL